MKFGNTANKVRAILDVFNDGEMLKGKEITQRLESSGYRVNEGNIRMFIYHYMIYKYLKQEVINGANHYFAV